LIKIERNGGPPKQSIMAATSPALHLWLFLHLYLFATALLSVCVASEDFQNLTDAEEKDRSSVKKELGRNPDKWSGTGISEEEEIEPIKGLYLDEGAHMLSSFLRTVANRELGVAALQSIYDSLPFGVFAKDDAAKTRELGERLQRKLIHYWGLVNQSRNAIEELFWHHIHRPLVNPVSCSDLPDSIMRFSSHFGAVVSDQLACDISFRNQSPSSFIPGHNLTQIFSNNLKIAPSVKWQYFMGADGGLNEFPAHAFDSQSGHTMGDPVRRRDLYFSSVYPEPRYVVMVIDHGSALSRNQLNIAKAIGKYIVSTLSEKDHIGLVALADEPHYGAQGDCFTKGLTQATQDTKLRIDHFIDGLSKAKAPANHTLGITHALDMARRALLMSSSAVPPTDGDCPMKTLHQVSLVYISRGLLSSLAEPRRVLELIALGQMCLQGRLVINTYALIDDGKPIMYEKTFLQDVALQNYSRYNVSFVALDKLSILAGQALAINSTRFLSSTIGNYLNIFHNHSGVYQAPFYSPPFWDPIGKGLVVSITQPCYHLDLLIGAVGLDIHLSDLVEDMTYFNQPGGRSYAFLIDTFGTVVMHPALVRPHLVTEEPVSSDIGMLESLPGFPAIRSSLLSVPSGSQKLVIDDEHNSTVNFTWERVAGGAYIVCIVTRTKSGDDDIHALRRVAPTNNPELVYHRLDVVSSPGKVEVCRYFRQLSTLAAGSLYLSPASYLSSFKFESWAEQSPVVIQSFMAFLNDKTKLIANPGLRSGVRSDVGALTQLIPYWKSQFGHSPLSQFIVRRYAATPSGVMNEYPAAVRHASFDPVRRPWYQKAMEFPGKVVVTGPSLDPTGSGYVVSVSHTIYEGKTAALHGPWDDVVAVVGADFTLNYMHRIVSDTLPFCPDRNSQVKGSNIRCFLMDERGYLLAHPNLLEPLEMSSPDVEHQHLTHHEPLVASDLLNHDSFVLKKACHSYSDRTIQRFYQLNLTLNDQWVDRNGAPDPPVPVLTNLVHGEHCIRYQIVAIQGTNLFVGVVNQTCDTATAFCPCSTVDRLCLNCHRMEQSECECPCECQLELDTCSLTREPSIESYQLPTCPIPSESGSSLHSYPRFRDLELLPACLALDCEERVSESECYGVVGCQWCVRDTDSQTPLQVPFCTEQKKCFGGVLRGFSPYADDSDRATATDSNSSFKSMPVGPVIGGVMALFFFVAFSIYCYRQRHNRHGSNTYGLGPGANLRMSHLDNELDEHEMELDADETTAVVSHEFSLAAGLDNVAIVSPYRVNTHYRRPTAGDSDHGYSTMTPGHEDSEHAASFVEPLMVARPSHRPSTRSPKGHLNSKQEPLRSISPVYSRPSYKIESPATLHESADELDDSQAAKRKHQLDVFNDSLAMTILPDSPVNQIIVPVTVHMVDTT